MISKAAREFVYHEAADVVLLHGDCLEVMRSMADNSVDSIVTDPPYGLRFMGKKWDYDVPSVEIWAEALRVLKPGGYLLSFSGSRTYHRMTINIEDAGFEIRDQIQWLYGSGFPKSLDVSKAIDKAAGVEREVVGISEHYSEGRNKDNFGVAGDGITGQRDRSITAPATPEAEEWDGWGTALKPAHEPICMARKPIEGTVAENVLEYGTGGLNIDACRIGVPGDKSEHYGAIDKSACNMVASGIKERVSVDNSKGRWPANVILDEDAGAMLDEQTGELTSGANPERRGSDKFRDCYGEFGGQEACSAARGADSGGASRFFYCAKASKADRDEGLEYLPERSAGIKNESGRGLSEDDPYKDIQRRNHHPTVKPTDLMQYLVRLVTPPGGTVLDPFMGSGSTGKGAVREGLRFIGIEDDAVFLPISKARINAPAQVGLC